MNVAIVYDRVNKWGGAERVLLALHDIFPNAPLFTSVYDKKASSWAKKFEIKTSFLQNLPFSKSRHEYFPFLMPIAFESFDFDGYDLVISVTSEAAKGIITKPSTKHLCICLTPTRYLWSGYKEYFSNYFLRFLSIPFIWYLKKWDKIAAFRPDKFIAISNEVKMRIKKYYNQESSVIYPGIDIKNFAFKNSGKSDYFLVVSRISKFTSYKRVDLAIRAATKLNLPLVVVGQGNTKSLKKIAGKSVKFTGKVSDSELFDYYANCRALIFPGLEDFGLAMVEAQASGKPVIAYRGGGALEIVKEGITGEFFDDQNVESLVEVLKNFHEHDYNNHICRENAKRFSKENFEKNIKDFVSKL
ncbi:MAG TPA: glycosyltransferase [Patescibacteria group bacterium]